VGWEFAALFDDRDHTFYWLWRRIADDSGQVLHASATRFSELEMCIEDAKKHGFHDSTTGPGDA